ncbi:MAG: DUF2147 domain-containing protein [Pseudomonadota bacterium]
MMAVLAAVALLGADVAAPPNPLIGRWRTEKRNGIVELAPCGPAICGKVLDGAPLRANPDQRDVRNRDAALRVRRVMGLRVLEGFTGGPRTWTGGPMYDPDTGDGASSGYLTLLNPDTLQVKGCIVAFLCRTQTWTRIR